MRLFFEWIQTFKVKGCDEIFLTTGSKSSKKFKNNSMFLNPTSVTEIKKIISKMQPKNSTGIDEIPISFLKSSFDHILFGLCHIFNLSLSQGQFIIDFKKAKVIPVHKKGQKTNVNNYRPINLLPVPYVIDCIHFCHNQTFSMIYNLDLEKITPLVMPIL